MSALGEDQLPSSPHPLVSSRMPRQPDPPEERQPARLLSIRLCIVLCFALVVVVTAATVAAVLITSTYRVVQELQATTAQTISQVQSDSETILSEVSSATLQMLDNLTNSSLTEQSELSEFTALQVSEMASALMSRDLDLMEQQLEAQMSTVVT
eukprot:RCo032380